MATASITLLLEEESQTPEKLSAAATHVYEAILNKYPDAENFKWDSFEVEELNNADTVGLGIKGPGTCYLFTAEV